MSKGLRTIKYFLQERFNLNEDKADEQRIVAEITRNVHFKGTNLWTLIFAIFIASIGLNVNSTAVIIGAMLISPLMGPIMGIGLAIAINDFDLLKKGIKNLAIAVIISVATSSIYFSVTPLHDASSELLARTNPSIWDVFIALLGGLAGIVAGTRREKSNVIPGVAIATALMPPLCTAGFGIATGKLYYFLGAAYLFFINSVFICLATFLIVKHLKFRKKEFATAETEKRVSRYILLAVILTLLPSVYLGYRIVQRSIFENNANKFVQTEFHFTKTQVVTHTYKYNNKGGEIDLLLVGQPLDQAIIDSLQKRLSLYHLSNTALNIRQGLDAKQQIDLSAIKASVLEEVFAAELVSDTLKRPTPGNITEVPDISLELKALYPSLIHYTLESSVFTRLDSIKRDTLFLFVGRFSDRVKNSERNKISRWLKERIQADSVKVVIE
ncbi:TIGR00341 family protein [Chitinophaga pinensis]|uniref:TIGR00341 family protein n=1 Tax=Chitinophaga pinensis (strain ATCC 43595 / DSM 2588 / LMG 13176 / NBRC 15968 / NCIMB 11800 / UQM 2034) TaxID=485918 RepID=A0A979G7F0_CHIPD|nr:TIGR00341 family protein [Chitinophaga pinensis]ACU62101.1 conserved hypothetical protein [Chitinophaga pinensis DSM 2588]